MITQDRLKEVLSYDPDAGTFAWIVTRRGLKSGSAAGGARPDGYVRICVDGKLYYAHRLAFLFMEGKWPDDIIDHANGNPSDNRWVNLRAATQTQNLGNTAKRKSRGYKGAYFQKEKMKWRAVIQIDRKQRSLGLFDSELEAHAAYCEAAAHYFGKFARAA